MEFEIIPVTPFMQNCSVIWDPETKEGAVIDPGGDLEKIYRFVESNDIKIAQILLTHCHIDHAGATADCAEHYQAKIIGPQKAEQFWIDALPASAQQLRFPPAKVFTPDQWLEDGDKVQVGAQTIEVIHTPGHTPGHVVFYHKGAELAWVGDVLFQGSIGRTDFPLSNHQSLIDSITQKLWPLGDQVKFVPGHGPMSTFGQERQTNPFVADKVFG